MTEKIENIQDINIKEMIKDLREFENKHNLDILSTKNFLIGPILDQLKKDGMVFEKQGWTYRPCGPDDKWIY